MVTLLVMRCVNCGVELPSTAAVACTACGVALASTEGGAPAYPVNVERGVLSPVAATVRLWLDALPRTAPIAGGVALIGFIGIAALEKLYVNTTAVFPYTVAWALLSVVIQMYGMATMTVLVDDRAREKPLAMFAALKRALGPTAWLVVGYGAMTLALLFVATPTILFLVGVALNAYTPVIIATGVLFFAFAVILVRLIPTLPLLVLERLPIHRALARAWVLTRTWRLKLTVATLVFVALYAVVLGGTSMALLQVMKHELLFRAGIVGVNALLGALPVAFGIAVYAAARGRGQAPAP